MASVFGLVAMAALPMASADTGTHLWNTGDYEQALHTWQQASANGDTDAALRLATAYRRGPIAIRDSALAGRWYRVAAAQGDPTAQYELGLMYELGVGVTQDIDQAARWYSLATDQGVCPGEMRDDFGLDLGLP